MIKETSFPGDGPATDTGKEVTTGTGEKVESVRKSLVMDVCEFYGRPYDEQDKGQPSMRTTAERFGISPLKVKKILVTGGLFRTPLSDEIQTMHLSGIPMKEIAARKKMSIPNVGSYLPYSRVIDNLDVGNEEAGRTLKWRQQQADRIIGRPAEDVQSLFDDTLRKFQAVYPDPLNVRLAVCTPEDGAVVLSHLARSMGYSVAIPAGQTLEEYVRGVDGIPLLYGKDGEGRETDTILLRADGTALKETIIRLLAENCHRRQENGGRDFRRECCQDGDELERKIMQTGYTIWAGYITEKMADRVLGRKSRPKDAGSAENRERDLQEIIRTCNPALMPRILLGGGSDQLKGTCAVVRSHGDSCRISKEFIWRLGCIFLMECEGLQMNELRIRLKKRTEAAQKR